MNAAMAERKASPQGPAEQDSLSQSVRDLILAQTVEERRKQRDDDVDATAKGGRRRDDQPTNPADDDR
jgi:hypothetical protein